MDTKLRACIATLLLLLGLTVARAEAQAQDLSAAEARAIAKEAYIYGFPMVDSYRIQHAYFVDRGNAEFKAAWNQIGNVGRVYTPADRAIQTPNSDTPYSFLGADLRAEPLVLTMPEVEHGRYYSAQFIDMYTHNFAYVGTRATGNGAARYLLAGPGWKGGMPEGVRAVIRSETEFALVMYRTQLFAPADIGNVHKIQAGYKVQTLSQFLGTPAPAATPAIDFVRPLSAQDERTSPAFFNILGFLLQYAPVHPSEQGLRARFARLSIAPGKSFDVARMTPELRAAVEAGIADAWREYAALPSQLQSSDFFGARETLRNNYLYRMAGAVRGIYGNSRDEATYRGYQADSAGQALDGRRGRYVLRFAPGQLPPVNAFWSLTMYELPARQLVANPLQRYLINSPMLPALRRDPDGGITLYIQRESPGADREINWLPAPDGPFFVGLRAYLPKPELQDGSWKQPPIARVD
ncbi:DUF1254 domain-containing protein [Sphingomonas cavernae]|uniref:DUF1254 domain-containing protein n=1 Tax=Sphingomonas cavernae TaxID=2320861 RepID=A0A418WSQ4_9SPHN|nr:DUF1254 domain-containing protein [Sphingomonas cavernae]RJF94245.1 DUF1254 domain-containing protein [Sphingomonas cavernae]